MGRSLRSPIGRARSSQGWSRGLHRKGTNLTICGSRPSRTTSLVRRYKLLPPTCLGVWKLIVCKTCRIIWTARSTRSSSLEPCVLTLLVSSPIAMSQTSALCKLIATASSASNCCKCLVCQITILPYCPPQKRNRNGSHPAAPNDKPSDRERIKSVKKTSSASKSRAIPQHKQCKRQGCVSRGTSVTHTHAQC